MRLSRTITANNRPELVKAVEAAPAGAQFDLIDAPRSTQQNKLLWALLAQISNQVEHAGERWEPEAWKACFMKAIGLKLQFMPSLDGQSVVAVGYKSSHLDKEKFSELIESIYAFGATHGVDFEAERGDALRGIALRREAQPCEARQGPLGQGVAWRCNARQG